MRALAQRCTKLYAQQVLNVLPDNAKSTMSTAINLIQVGFDDLSRASYSADISQQIALIKSSAATVISLVSAPPRREMLLNVSNEADKMTVQADKTTDLLIKTAKSNSASIISISGKQRFLSQRIAKTISLLRPTSTPRHFAFRCKLTVRNLRPLFLPCKIRLSRLPLFAMTLNCSMGTGSCLKLLSTSHVTVPT
jgi:hypothetical protein